MHTSKSTKKRSVTIVAAYIGGIFVLVAALIEFFQPLVEIWGQRTLLAPQSTEAPTSNTQLGFIQNGDVWLKDIDYDTLTQLTNIGNVLYFAWSPDGRKIVVLTDKEYCILEVKSRSVPGCHSLTLTYEKEIENYRAVWSFDEKYIVFWLDSLGGGDWVIVEANNPSKTLHIDNPFDWGVQATEWGLREEDIQSARAFMGSAAFTKEGNLFGTIGNTGFCGAVGCSYKIYEFDFMKKEFHPVKFGDVPQEDLYADPYLLTSGNGNVMWFTERSCSKGSPCLAVVRFSYGMHVTEYDLRKPSLESEMMDESPQVALSPDGSLFAISTGQQVSERTVFCLNSDRLNFPIQIVDFATNATREIAGGYNPAWAPNGRYLAFESCLVNDQNGNWIPLTTSPLRIFTADLTTRDLSIVPLAEGIFPSWRPKPK